MEQARSVFAAMVPEDEPGAHGIVIVNSPCNFKRPSLYRHGEWRFAARRRVERPEVYD